MNELMVMTLIAGRRCVFRANDVQSVIDLGTVTPVPQTPKFIAGISAMRSQALTVIDTRLALGFDEVEWATDERAAVVTISGHSYALVIDAIEDITSSTGEPGQISGGFGPEWSRVATGMIETSSGPALLIDLDALIAGPVDPSGGLSSAA